MGSGLTEKSVRPLSFSYYWDMVREPFGDYPAKIRLYCNNTSCSSYNNGLWFAGSVLYGYVDAHSHVEKY